MVVKILVLMLRKWCEIFVHQDTKGIYCVKKIITWVKQKTKKSSR